MSSPPSPPPTPPPTHPPPPPPSHSPPPRPRRPPGMPTFAPAPLDPCRPYTYSTPGRSAHLRRLSKDHDPSSPTFKQVPISLDEDLGALLTLGTQRLPQSPAAAAEVLWRMWEVPKGRPSETYRMLEARKDYYQLEMYRLGKEFWEIYRDAERYVQIHRRDNTCTDEDHFHEDHEDDDTFLAYELSRNDGWVSATESFFYLWAKSEIITYVRALVYAAHAVDKAFTAAKRPKPNGILDRLKWRKAYREITTLEDALAFAQELFCQGDDALTARDAPQATWCYLTGLVYLAPYWPSSWYMSPWEAKLNGLTETYHGLICAAVGGLIQLKALKEARELVYSFLWSRFITYDQTGDSQELLGDLILAETEAITDDKFSVETPASTMPGNHWHRFADDNRTMPPHDLVLEPWLKHFEPAEFMAQFQKLAPPENNTRWLYARGPGENEDGDEDDDDSWMWQDDDDDDDEDLFKYDDEDEEGNSDGDDEERPLESFSRFDERARPLGTLLERGLFGAGDLDDDDGREEQWIEDVAEGSKIQPGSQTSPQPGASTRAEAAGTVVHVNEVLETIEEVSEIIDEASKTTDPVLMTGTDTPEADDPDVEGGKDEDAEDAGEEEGDGTVEGSSGTSTDKKKKKQKPRKKSKKGKERALDPDQDEDGDGGEDAGEGKRVDNLDDAAILAFRQDLQAARTRVEGTDVLSALKFQAKEYGYVDDMMRKMMFHMMRGDKGGLADMLSQEAMNLQSGTGTGWGPATGPGGSAGDAVVGIPGVSIPDDFQPPRRPPSSSRKGGRR